MTQNFDANSTNVTEVRTNELTNIRTDKRKGENYIPVGINAGGITKELISSESVFAHEKGGGGFHGKAQIISIEAETFFYICN